MTRTERSFNPRAVIRDRSESKSGLDKSDRKGGAGAHNWGAYADEQEHEFRAAFEDYEDDAEGEEGPAPGASFEDVKEELATDTSKVAHDGSIERMASGRVSSPSAASDRRVSNGFSEQEIRQAREFRAKALKDGSDLVSIARTSAAVSTSPPRQTSDVKVTTDAQTSVTA